MEILNLHETFYNELQSLIKDFTKKKREYSKMFKIIKFLIITSTTLATLFVGLSFIDNFSLISKILAISFSSLATIFVAWDKTIEYKKLWQQRTNTLIALLELKRIYKIKLLPLISKGINIDKEINILFDALNAIMKNDIDEWDKNISQFGNFTIIGSSM